MSESGLQALRQEHDDYFVEFYSKNLGGYVPPQKDLDCLWYHSCAVMRRDSKSLEDVLAAFKGRWKDAHTPMIGDGIDILAPFCVLDLTINQRDFAPQQRVN